MSDLDRQAIFRGSKTLSLIGFALGGFIILGVGRKDYFALHVIFDTSILLISSALTTVLWEIGIRLDDSLFKRAAASFSVACFWEFIHVIVGVDWVGSLSRITQLANILRPSTWGPSVYVLPLGLGTSVWLLNSPRKAKAFPFALFTASLVLFILFMSFPRYTSPTLGISRPTLILVPILWTIVARMSWSSREVNRLLRPMTFASTVLVISNIAMLFSRAPHDPAAMVAHLGSVCSYALLFLGIIEMASSDMVIRQRAEEKFRGLLETAPDSVIVVDATGKIAIANAQTENLFGYSREELLGHEVEMLVPNARRAAHAEKRMEYFKNPNTRPMGVGLQLYGLHKSGYEIPIEVSLAPLRTEEGVLISCAIRDVTARREVEEELKMQAGILHEQAALLDVAHDAIMVRNFDGVISYWNRGAEKLYGWSREQAIGNITHSLLKTKFPCPFEEISTAILKTEKWEGELIHQTAYGTEIVVASRWVLQNDDKKNPTILEINNDITRRKIAEDEAHKQTVALAESNADLEAANKELEAFTYSVAHDLRAPIRHIHGFSKALIEDAGPKMDVEALDLVHEIIDGASNMSVLVDDLLALARISRQPLKIQVAGLGPLVDEVLRELKPETKDRDIQWEIGELPYADCDPGLIKQVFYNLISNAVKYSRPRKPAVIEITQNTVDGQSVIYVRDNGVGFNMKFADKLFGVFQRLHRKEDFEGTGVGLATVQRIIHKHGGRIWAQAELDKGATFFFTLATVHHDPVQGSKLEFKGAS